MRLQGPARAVGPVYLAAPAIVVGAVVDVVEETVTIDGQRRVERGPGGMVDIQTAVGIGAVIGTEPTIVTVVAVRDAQTVRRQGTPRMQQHRAGPVISLPHGQAQALARPAVAVLFIEMLEKILIGIEPDLQSGDTAGIGEAAVVADPAQYLHPHAVDGQLAVHAQNSMRAALGHLRLRQGGLVHLGAGLQRLDKLARTVRPREQQAVAKIELDDGEGLGAATYDIHRRHPPVAGGETSAR